MFKYVDTTGIPLDILIERLYNSNYIPDWIDFYESAINSNWNIKTVLNKIEYSLVDVKGKEYKDEVMLRLKIYIMSKHNEKI